MIDGTPFKDIRLNGKPLETCEMVLECNKTNYRLYVDRENENRFYAIALEFNSCSAGGDVWSCENLRVDPLFNVTAYFDGVRHLEFNREVGDMAGYIYYPNIEGLAKMLAKVREIELEVCRDCDE